MQIAGTLNRDVTDGQPANVAAPCVASRGAVSVFVKSGLQGDLDHHAQALLDAYLSRGRAFVDDWRAVCAFCLVDQDSGYAAVAVDRMGIERIAYRITAGGCVFASSLDTVRELAARDGDTTFAVLPQQLFNFLFFHMIPSPETVFDGIQKLEPATVLERVDGEFRTRRYWQPAFIDRAPGASRADLIARLHGHLESAVSNCKPDAETGAFLSGGLDSSTVSGYLAKVADGDAHTFSIGFGEPGYDELEYARASAAHFGCQPHEYVVVPDDISDTFEAIAASTDEPFGNSSVVPTLMCARLARRTGFTRLLAGDGGDEFFAGNERYAAQKVFELYGRIPRVLRQTMMDPLAAVLKDTAPLPLRKFKSYVEQANVPLPERLERWNFAYREGVQQMIDPQFAGRIDVDGPMALMRSTFEVCRAQSSDMTNRLLSYDWKYTLADNDFRKVTSMCHLEGIDVSFPMSDADLVDFSTELPGPYKMRALKLRSFYRDAMRGFLPDVVLNKPKHGFGLPFGIWLKKDERLREMIFARLGDLKQRGIFQERFIDQLIADQRDGHASYFGYFIWDLAMLEQWLQHRSLTI